MAGCRLVGVAVTVEATDSVGAVREAGAVVGEAGAAVAATTPVSGAVTLTPTSAGFTSSACRWGAVAAGFGGAAVETTGTADGPESADGVRSAGGAAESTTTPRCRTTGGSTRLLESAAPTRDRARGIDTTPGECVANDSDPDESDAAASSADPAEPLVSANAIGADATAAPTPSAIASAPTRPTKRAHPRPGITESAGMAILRSGEGADARRA